MNPPGGTTSPFRILLVPLGTVLLLAGASDTHAEDAPSAPSNMRMLQSVAGQLADSLAAHTAQQESLSVALTINPQDVRWFLKETAERSFQQRGWTVASPGTARYAAEMSAYEMKVVYTNPRRTGMFGPKLVDRKVTMLAHLRLSDARDGRILTESERTAFASDTVEVSVIEALESPSIPQTHGVFPSEGFFAGWVEPLVVITAIGVAVFLLFTVRS